MAPQAEPVWMRPLFETFREAFQETEAFRGVVCLYRLPMSGEMLMFVCIQKDVKQCCVATTRNCTGSGWAGR